MRFFLYVLALIAPSAEAAQIRLSPSSVISSSVPFTPTYPASNVLDQQSGPTTEVFGEHYWLSPDNTRSPVFFVVDLGAALRLASAILYNTHNDGYQDRGAGAFTLLGGNTRPASGAMLAATALLVSGTLAAEAAAAPALTGQVFAITAPGAYRYVEFVPTTTATVKPAASRTAFGLNELTLFAAPVALPEPGTLAMLGTTLLAFAAVRLRPRSPGPAPAGTRRSRA